MERINTREIKKQKKKEIQIGKGGGEEDRVSENGIRVPKLEITNLDMPQNKSDIMAEQMLLDLYGHCN